MQGLMLSSHGYSGAPPPGTQLIPGPYGYQLVGMPSFQAAGPASLQGLDTAASSGPGLLEETGAAGGGASSSSAAVVGPLPPPLTTATVSSTVSNNNNNNNIHTTHQHADKGQAN